MNAVITVIGKDMVGILANVSTKCAELKVNITEVTQSILQDTFCMMMLVDMKNCTLPLANFSDEMKALGKEKGLSIHVMHEDVFDSMYHV